MKLVFVYWGYENAGSMLDLRGYARAARGHGPRGDAFTARRIRTSRSTTPRTSPAPTRSIFVFEWTTALQFGDRLDWTRLMEAVPRRRRVVIDCDGAYNDPIEFGGDYNHRTRGIEPLLDGRLRQPVGQDLPAHLPAAAKQRPPVPVPHLRSDLGDAARFRRQGIRA